MSTFNLLHDLLKQKDSTDIYMLDVEQDLRRYEEMEKVTKKALKRVRNQNDYEKASVAT